MAFLGNLVGFVAGLPIKPILMQEILLRDALIAFLDCPENVLPFRQLQGGGKDVAFNSE